MGEFRLSKKKVVVRVFTTQMFASFAYDLMVKMSTRCLVHGWLVYWAQIWSN